MYKSIPDKRNTSNGMTPAKSISRPSNPPVKPIVGNYNKQKMAMQRKFGGKS